MHQRAATRSTRLGCLGALLLAAAAAAPAPARQPPALFVVRFDDGTMAPGGTIPARRLQPPPPQPGLPPLPVTRLEEPGAAATLDTTRLSLRLAEPLPVRDVLLLLVRDTGLSLAPDPDIEGTFIGEFRDVTLRQALELVLRPRGLDYAVEGTAIRVFRRRRETRWYEIDVALVRRRAEAILGVPAAEPSDTSGTAPAVAARAPSGEAAQPPIEGPPVGGLAARVATRAGEDALDAIAEGARSLLSPEGRLSLDRKAGVLQATDYSERLDRLALYLETVGTRLHRQVEIDARVLEVTLADPAAAGVDWARALERARRQPIGREPPPLDFA
ncbi:MAG TPA: hypothetical protein VNK92_02910, partial [Vicinamibacterales bacterium]|nr:hypothetical protein [Vicinamibacterales bacterium]